MPKAKQAKGQKLPKGAGGAAGGGKNFKQQKKLGATMSMHSKRRFREAERSSMAAEVSALRMGLWCQNSAQNSPGVVIRRSCSQYAAGRNAGTCDSCDCEFSKRKAVCAGARSAASAVWPSNA